MPRCFSIEIPEPCTVGWENMQGEDKSPSSVRFCGLCSKNVYNLSDMTEEEVADLIEVRGAKICVSIRRRADGTVYTDNCPRRWRVVRDFCRARLPVALVILAWVFHQSVADAQGLPGMGIMGGVGGGEPPDPRFGRSNEIGGYLDCGYETARDLSRLVTAASFGVTATVAWFCVHKVRLRRFNLALGGMCVRNTPRFVRRAYLKWAILVIVVPLAVHLFGTFAINDFGSIGGGF